MLNESVNSSSLGTDSVHCICISLILNHKSTGLQHLGTEKPCKSVSPASLQPKIRAGFWNQLAFAQLKEAEMGKLDHFPRPGQCLGDDCLEAVLVVRSLVWTLLSHTNFGWVAGRTDYNPLCPPLHVFKGLGEEGLLIPKLRPKDNSSFKFQSFSVCCVWWVKYQRCLWVSILIPLHRGANWDSEQQVTSSWYSVSPGKTGAETQALLPASSSL